MTFPTTSAPTVSGNISSAGTSHVVDRPGASHADDLILMLAAVWADDLDGPGGSWVNVYSGDSGTVVWNLWALKDSGSEPATWTFTTPSARKSAIHIYRIVGWGGTVATDIDANVVRNNSSSTPDFNTITADWGSDDNLFFLALAQYDNTNATLDGHPGSYTSDGTTGTAGFSAGAKLTTYRRELAASSDSPSDGSKTDANLWVSWGCVVKPGTAGVPATGRVMGRLAGIGGLAATGGLAGLGGGLAG